MKIGAKVGYTPSLELDFLNQKYKSLTGTVITAKTFAELITFTRATTASRFNQLGALEFVASGVARFNYDPMTKSTSATSNALTAGRKTFATTVQYTVGQTVWATNDMSHYMSGNVIAATGSSVTLVVGDNIVGTGTFTSWILIAAKGLMVEEARTNLALNSNSTTLLTPTRATYVDDGALFIDSLSAFRKLQEDTTATASHVGQPATLTLTALGTYTCSYFVKAAGRTKFILSMTNTNSFVPGNTQVQFDLVAKTATLVNGAIGGLVEVVPGVFRCHLTVTVGATDVSSSPQITLRDAAGATVYSGDGTSGLYIGGLVTEAGAYPSSYIVTTGTAAARNVDLATVATMSPWYNQPEGTLFSEFTQDCNASAVNSIARRAAALNGGASDYIELNRGSTGTAGGGIVTGGTGQTAFGGIAVAERAVAKVALAYRLNDCAASTNGSEPILDTSVNLFTATVLGIGQRGLGQGPLGGEVRILRYIPKRVDPQALTRMAA